MSLRKYLGFTWLINAEDRSKAKLDAFNKNAKESVSAVKDIGSKAKASTELVGTLAAVLGGGQFGAAAGEVAQLTERVSAFSEMGHQGKAGMLALRAGIVLAVGAIAIKLGQAIGNSIWQVEKWKKKAEEAREEFTKISQASLDWKERIRDAELENINLTQDHKKRNAQLKEFQDDIEFRVGELRKTEQRLEKTIASMTDDHFLGIQTGNHLANLEREKSELESTRAELESLRRRRNDFTFKNSDVAKEIQAKKEKIALEQKQKAASDAYLSSLRNRFEQINLEKSALEKLNLERAKLNPSQRKEAEGMLAAIKKHEADKKAKVLADQRRKDEEAAMEKRKAFMTSLKQQMVQLKDGDFAAQVFNLKNQGHSEVEARNIANFNETAKRIQKLKNLQSVGDTPLQKNNAVGSRLLAGHQTKDPVLQTAKKSLETQQMIREELKKLNFYFEQIQQAKSVTQAEAFGEVN